MGHLYPAFFLPTLCIGMSFMVLTEFGSLMRYRHVNNAAITTTDKWDDTAENTQYYISFLAGGAGSRKLLNDCKVALADDLHVFFRHFTNDDSTERQ